MSIPLKMRKIKDKQLKNFRLVIFLVFGNIYLLRKKTSSLDKNANNLSVSNTDKLFAFFF